jgi:glucose-6-phosphate isomerase
MLPAVLMGLNPKKFKQFDHLINNKKFLNTLVLNASAILSFHNSGKTNSIILNYDESSKEIFDWYHQLVAESLGKKIKGIQPIISSMPKDNHSVMQLYLDGIKNNFFTFFITKEKKSAKILNSKLLGTLDHLKNKNLNDVIYSQFLATQNIFKRKNIPFRSFIIKKRNEETLGELFTFFILETILIGRSLNIDPFNQPAVELIKKETSKVLKSI